MAAKKKTAPKGSEYMDTTGSSFGRSAWNMPNRAAMRSKAVKPKGSDFGRVSYRKSK